MRTSLISCAATLAAGLALAAPSPALAASCDAADDIPTAGALDEAGSATLCLLNRERSQRGLRALRSNGRLRRAAEDYSRSMVVRNFFDHVSPGGSTMTGRIKATDYLNNARGWALGENIAWGGGDLATPREIVDAWMHSAGHRANILSRSFDEIGVGIALGAPRALPSGMDAATYTTDFGARG